MGGRYQGGVGFAMGGVRIVGPNGRDQAHTPGGDPTQRKVPQQGGGTTGTTPRQGEFRAPGLGVVRVLVVLAVIRGWKVGAGSLGGKEKGSPYLRGWWLRRLNKPLDAWIT